MAKRVDLFTINILGLSDTLNGLTALESELKAVNSLVSKHTKTVKDFEQAQKSGVEISERMFNAYADAKSVLPGLVSDQNKLTNQIRITNAVIDKEVQEYRELEKEKKREIAATKKQDDEEKKLQADLQLQVRSIEDLAKKTNAMVTTRKRLDLTTEEGRKKYEALTREIKKNSDQLKMHDEQIGVHARNVGNYSSAVSGMFNAWAKGAAIVATAGKAIEYTIKIIGNETEGVEQAFARLNNPGALDQLRNATKNTVSDLNLMKSAVKADNFKIPMDALAKGLQFAQKQAKATGGDVNYLVDSFVMGIGRKSSLILDNLGISSVELREKLKGIGTESATTAQIAAAVMEVVDDRMKQFGEDTNIAAEKAGQLTAVWENLRNQATKKLSNFLSPLAEWGKTGLIWITKNTDAIWTFIKVMAAATAVVYSYVAGVKLQVIWQNLSRTSTDKQTFAVGRQIIALKGATASTQLLAAANLLLTGNIKGAIVAMRMFWATLVANPVGLVLAGLAAVAGAVYLLGTRAKSTEDIINDLNKATENYNNELKRLNEDIAEYEKLQEKAKSQTKLDKDEHERLNSIIERLTTTVPGLKVEFDKYGNAMIVNAGMIREFARVHSQANAIILYNERKDAKKRRTEIEKEQERLQEIFTKEKTYKMVWYGNQWDRAEVSTTDSDKKLAIKEYKKLDSELMELNNSIFHSDAALKGIHGTLENVMSIMDEGRRSVVIQGARTIKVIDEEIKALRELQTESSASKDKFLEYQKQINALEKEKEGITGSTSKNPKDQEKSLEAEENAAKKRADLIISNAKLIDKIIQETDRIELENEAEKIEREISLQKQGDKEKLAQLKQSIEDQQREIEKAISDEEKRIKKSKKPASQKELDDMQKLKSQSTGLGDEYEKAEKEISSAERVAFEKEKIYKKSTIDELEEYKKRLQIAESYSQEEIDLIDKVIEYKNQKQDDALSKESQKELNKLQITYQAEKDIINATIADQAEKAKKLAELDLLNAQDKYAILKKEYELRLANGSLSVDEVERIKKKLKEVFDQIGVFAEQSKRTTPLAKMLGIDDEQAALLKDKAIELAQDISSTIANIQIEKNRAWLDNETKRIDEAKEKELNSLEQRKKRGLMSEEIYERSKNRIDGKYEKQKLEMERQAFEKEKDIKKKQALMEMALGIARIWATMFANPISAGIMSAALVATTALSIAEINAQQFAKGGKVLDKLPNGKVRYNPNIKTMPNGDNILATVKTGEVILNEKQQRQLGGDSVFRAIGVPGFASGGKISTGPWYSAPIPESPERITARNTRKMTDNEFISYIDKKMDSKIKSIRFYCLESDITDTTNAVKGVIGQSQLL